MKYHPLGGWIFIVGGENSYTSQMVRTIKYFAELLD